MGLLFWPLCAAAPSHERLVKFQRAGSTSLAGTLQPIAMAINSRR